MSQSFAMDHSDHSSSITPGEELFTCAELRGFEADDSTAGRAIGKMLSILFVYTVIAMSIVVAWTFNSVNSEPGRFTPTPHHGSGHR